MSFLYFTCIAGMRICLLFLNFLFFFVFSFKVAFCENVNQSLPSLEGNFGKWNVFTIYKDNRKVCYLVSSPIDLSGNHKDNRNPYIMVSLFNKTLKQEISITAGYIYRANSIVSVSIDGKQERFVAESETLAWTERVGSDKRIINEMLNGFKIFVFAESYANTYSVDTYSLSGFKQAYQKAISLCKND